MPLRGKGKKLNAEQLWEYALASLGRRAQSIAELRRKLNYRAERQADVAGVLAKLAEYQLANDRKFSETFAAARLQNQGLGKSRVLRDLRAKQVPDRIASAAVEKTYVGTDENELIDAYLQRKYRNTDLKKLLKEPKNFAAAYRKLRMAGFGSANCIRVLRAYSTLADNWAESEEAEEE